MNKQFKVIETKFLSATNTLGQRITAFDGSGNQITIGYPYELSGFKCQRRAAQALADKMKWTGELKGGWTKNGCAFILEEK
jgi:hypothetical protein